MQIKKFTAPTLKEATEQMKTEFGGEAIILSSKLIESDSTSGNRRIIEITVGYDKADPLVTEPEIVNSTESGKTSEVINELENLSSVIERNKKSRNSANVIQPQLFNEVLNKNYDKSELEKDLKEVVETLQNREVLKSVISLVFDQMQQYKPYLHSSNLDNYVLSTISSMIPVKGFELLKSSNPKVAAFVGPTGVGKTTCIAKLAFIAKLIHKLKVGIITTDTFRLGALNQLKIFSDVSEIDLLIAYEPSEVNEFVKKFSDKDLILIDTAGRSQKNDIHLNKTRQYLENILIDETFLVLSSNYSTKTLIDITDKFSKFNYTSFIFTKIDESVSFGNIFNIVTRTNLPITFLSNGQIIPDDIISADADFLANLIYTGKLSK